MDKIYVPNLSNYKCVVVRDSNTIRAYKQQPQLNGSADYVDYYYMSHYFFNNGNQSWNQYSTLPTCLNSSDLTSDFYYRTDMPLILIMFIIICLFGFGLPLRIFLRMFRRWN